MIFKGTARIVKEEEWFVATCLENDIASQGKTITEAVENLKEAITLYYEDEDKKDETDFIQKETYITTIDMTI